MRRSFEMGVCRTLQESQARSLGRLPEQSVEMTTAEQQILPAKPIRVVESTPRSPVPNHKQKGEMYPMLYD
jgi:hypothetical protein